MTPTLRANLFLAIVLTAAIVYAALSTPQPIPYADFPQPEAQISLVLSDIQEHKLRGYHAVATVDSIDGKPVTPFRLLAYLPVEELPSERLTVKGEDLLLSLSGRSLPYEFDEAQRARKRGCAASALISFNEDNCAESTFTDSSSPLALALSRTPGLTPEARNFLNTALLGDSYALSNATRESFAQAGLAHVLCVSGLHVNIIFTLALFLLMPLMLFGVRRDVTAVVALALVWGYVAACGGVAALRAGIMLSALVVAWCCGRENSGIRAVLLAMAIILFISPSSLRDVGAQMSFVATLALVLAAKGVRTLAQKVPPYILPFAAAVCLSAAAFIASLPLIAAYFGRIPLMSVPANIVCSPLLPVILYAGIFAMLFSALGLTALATVASTVVNAVVKTLTATANFFSVANLEHGLTVSAAIVGWSFVAIGTIMAVRALGLRRGRALFARFGLTSAAMGIVMLCLSTNTPQPSAAVREIYAVTTMSNVKAAEVSGDTLKIYILPTTSARRQQSIPREAQWRWADFLRARHIRRIQLHRL
ncbi:MAG: ComEC/Rec2 family competence protein [Muribaculaceae bacterium]|nr:ComEC/Rec2 family competence protein [Muribaculaceae bacterium]